MLTSEMSRDQMIEETRKTVELVFRGLVNEPDEVRVTALVGTHQVIFEVSMAAHDKGRAIGLGGRYRLALETLLSGTGGNHGLRYSVPRIM